MKQKKGIIVKDKIFHYNINLNSRDDGVDCYFNLRGYELDER